MAATRKSARNDGVSAPPEPTVVSTSVKVVTTSKRAAFQAAEWWERFRLEGGSVGDGGVVSHAHLGGSQLGDVVEHAFGTRRGPMTAWPAAVMGMSPIRNTADRPR